MNTIVGIYTEHCYAQKPMLKGELKDAPWSVKKLIKETDKIFKEVRFYHNHYVIAFDEPNGSRMFLGINDGWWNLATDIGMLSDSKYLCVDDYINE